jgi:hypothetical protein
MSPNFLAEKTFAENKNEMQVCFNPVTMKYLLFLLGVSLVCTISEASLVPPCVSAKPSAECTMCNLVADLAGIWTTQHPPVQDVPLVKQNVQVLCSLLPPNNTEINLCQQITDTQMSYMMYYLTKTTTPPCNVCFMIGYCVTAQKPRVISI